MFNYIHFTVKISKLCSKPNASDKDPGCSDLELQIQWSFWNNAMKTARLWISCTNIKPQNIKLLYFAKKTSVLLKFEFEISFSHALPKLYKNFIKKRFNYFEIIYLKNRKTVQFFGIQDEVMYKKPNFSKENYSFCLSTIFVWRLKKSEI